MQLGPPPTPASSAPPTTTTTRAVASPSAAVAVATVRPRSPELRKGRVRMPPSPPPELAPPKRARRLVLYDDGGFPGGVSDDDEEEDPAADGGERHAGPALNGEVAAGQREAALVRDPPPGDDVETLALRIQRAVRLDAPASGIVPCGLVPLGGASFMPYIL
jgi:hypothetical protein